MKELTPVLHLVLATLLPWGAAGARRGGLDAATSFCQVDSAFGTPAPLLADSLPGPTGPDRSPLEWQWQATAEKTGAQVAQDALQLVEAVLPVLPVHSGDVGLPLFAGSSGLPPRLVEICVDGVRWIPGVYGLVDITGLPEALAEYVSLQPSHDTLAASLTRPPLRYSFAPRRMDFSATSSSINFVRGPFGGDVLRAWIARRFSRRLAGHFTFDQANSSGQFLRMPYEGQKMSGDVQYTLTRLALLRYRFLRSDNEAGRAQPFYPEERPLAPSPDGAATESAGFGKEQRSYHGLEFSLPAIFVRPFYWTLRNEFRSETMRSRHRLEQAGVEAGFRFYGTRWASQLRAEFHDERIASTSVSVPRAQTYLAAAMFDYRSNSSVRARFAVAVRKEADWPVAFDADAGLDFTLNQKMRTYAEVSHRVINPAPAEFASTLALLQANAGLKPATLQRAAWAVRWQPSEKKWLQIQLAMNRLQAPFALDTLAASGEAYVRNVGNEDIPSVDFLYAWQVSRRLSAGGHGSWMLRTPPALFWYDHVRRGFTRAYVEWSQDFFGSDLVARLRLVWRYYAASAAPVYGASHLPRYVDVPGGGVADVQLFLRHGSGTVYFSFENVFDADLEWRPGVAAPGRFLKWGVSWDFQN